MTPTGYWNAPCGVVILTVDGMAEPLVQHIRVCGACKVVLNENRMRATIPYSDKINITPEIAAMLEDKEKAP